ncbi:hypothetical protein NOGI109294_09180 [Nocardiopsis gilva]
MNTLEQVLAYEMKTSISQASIPKAELIVSP